MSSQTFDPATGQRTRTDGGRVQQAPLQIWTKPNSVDPWVPGPTLSTIQTGIFNTMSDFVVPNFAKRKASGEVFFNRMSSSKWSSTSTGGQGYEQVNKFSPFNRVRIDGDWLGYTLSKGGYLSSFSSPSLLGESTIIDMMHEVSTEVLASRGMGAFGLAEDIAEWRQTVDMIGLFNSKVQVHLAHTLLKWPKHAANAYLMFRYGVQPLYSDLRAAFKGITKARRNPRVTTRAQLDEQRTQSTTQLYQGAGSIGTVVTTTREDSVIIRAMSLDEALSVQMHDMGVSVKSLATLPWELLGYSFVSDWFWNLGNYIKAHVPAVGYTNLGSTLTVSDSRKTTYEVTSNFDGTNFSLVRPNMGTVIVDEKTKRRQGLLSPAVGLNQSFGFDRATRVGDALALTAQRIFAAFSKTGR